MRLAIPLALLTGFIALSYEILWIRAFSFAVAGAAYAFALLLWAYLMGIAIGSYIVRDICAGERREVLDDFKVLALFIAVSNMGGVLVVPVMAWVVTSGAHPGMSLLPVILVAGALGAQLPLISHYGIPPDRLAGEKMSYIYVANIAGSVLGSLITGFVLFDIWTMSTITALLGALGIIVALLVYVAGGATSTRRAIAAALAVAVIALIALLTPVLFTDIWARLQLKEDYAQAGAFKYVVENRSGVITVDHNDVVYGGGVYDGQFSIDLVGDTNMIVRSYVLGLFHPRPRNILLVGLGSGSWATIAANHPDVERVTIVEINPGYLEIIEKYDVHRKLLSDERVEIVIDDARRWLRQNPGQKFDAIVANTTFHWRGQASNLLSIEWMNFISEHLADGGVYIFNTTGSKRAQRTALEAFPHCMGVINNVICSHQPFDYDPQRWHQELANYTLWGEPIFDLTQPLHQQTLDALKAFSTPVDVKTHDEAHHIFAQAYLERETRDAQLITDDNMGEEWSSFLGQTP